MQSEGAGNQIALQKKKDKMSESDPDARDKDIRSTLKVGRNVTNPQIHASENVHKISIII